MLVLTLMVMAFAVPPTVTWAPRSFPPLFEHGTDGAENIVSVLFTSPVVPVLSVPAKSLLFAAVVSGRQRSVILRHELAPLRA